MTIDIIKLKALATAAAANQYDAVALNDYGTAVSPATLLGLIAEIERHRQINAEGCKPDSIIPPCGMLCAGAAVQRDLNPAEGSPPEINNAHAVALGVLEERLRQMNGEGYAAERDDQYTRGQLADAAGAHARQVSA